MSSRDATAEADKWIALMKAEAVFATGDHTIEAGNETATALLLRMSPYDQEALRLAFESGQEEIAVALMDSAVHRHPPQLVVRGEGQEALERAVAATFPCAGAGHQSCRCAERPAFIQDTVAAVTAISTAQRHVRQAAAVLRRAFGHHAGHDEVRSILAWMALADEGEHDPSGRDVLVVALLDAGLDRSEVAAALGIESRATLREAVRKAKRSHGRPADAGVSEED